MPFIHSFDLECCSHCRSSAPLAISKPNNALWSTRLVAPRDFRSVSLPFRLQSHLLFPCSSRAADPLNFLAVHLSPNRVEQRSISPFECRSSVVSALRRPRLVRLTPRVIYRKMSLSILPPRTVSRISDSRPPVTISQSPRGTRRFASMRSMIRARAKAKLYSSMRPLF